jgi:hypothetical protein
MCGKKPLIADPVLSAMAGGVLAGGGASTDCTKYNDGGPCTRTETLFARLDPTRCLGPNADGGG